MKVTVFGMGYVGTVATAYLSGMGHSVQCVEPNDNKISDLNNGVIPFYEPELPELWANGKDKVVAAHPDELLSLGDVSIICVGTPPQDGMLRVDIVYTVIEQIIAHKDYHDQHKIIIRSTMPVGGCRRILWDYDLYNLTFMPEFLREGRAIHDIKEPSLACYASTDRSVDMMKLMETLWGYTVHDMDCHMQFEDAEMLKLACNAWHATKIVFTNEISRLCQSMGADAKAVMSGLCNDHVLNISKHYMNPGFSYGGSCLPKDVSELNSLAINKGVATPMLRHLHVSNDKHTMFTHDVVSELIKEHMPKDVYILGVAFKSHTDDLRNSEVVFLIYQLLASRFSLGVEYKLHIVDPHVSEANPDIVAMIEKHGKYIELCTVEQAASKVGNGDSMIVVTQENKAYEPVYTAIQGGQVVDLFNMSSSSKVLIASAVPPNSYHGLSW